MTNPKKRLIVSPLCGPVDLMLASPVAMAISQSWVKQPKSDQTVFPSVLRGIPVADKSLLFPGFILTQNEVAASFL